MASHARGLLPLLKGRRTIVAVALACCSMVVLFHTSRYRLAKGPADWFEAQEQTSPSLPARNDSLQPLHDYQSPYFSLSQEKIDLLKRYQPHHLPNKEGYAFATLLCTRDSSPNDIYLLATRVLLYRFLWHPATRSPDKPMVVFVAPFVPQWKRDILLAEGASVVELPLIDIAPKTTNLNSDRWRDQFIKLNMWNETQFSKIAYFDSDAVPLRRMDEIFEVADTWHCKEDLLDEQDKAHAAEMCDYTLAGVPILPFPAVGVNGGMLVLSPNQYMLERLLRMAPQTDKYDSGIMEQGLLEWAYDWQGAFPAHQLERKYNGVFPKAEEAESLYVVHQKIWNKDYDKEGLTWATRLWDDSWEAMRAFYTSQDFIDARKRDGYKLHDSVLR
jgi:alpha-N-acetylglucosamine transferase